MPDLRIHRQHDLGLEPARAIAHRWMDDARERFHMSCECQSGTEADTIGFQAPGVSGTLRVAADAFELEARLGFLLGPFSQRIEQEIAQQLDALLGSR